MILKLALGHRYEIALQYTVAQEQNGRYGKQFLYTLAAPKGHVLYVPPVAHAEIQSLHLEQGEVFTIRKSLAADSNAHVWDVQRVQIPESCDPPVVEPHPAPKPITSARAITAPPVADIPVPPSLTTPQSVKLFLQLCAVVQVAKAAEEFGKSIGREVRFESADIRAMAISGFIDEQQNRRVA